MTRPGLLWIASSLLILVADGRAAAPSGWKAGVAIAKITPEKLMWMSGYGGRNRPADGKITELWAKALVLEDGDGNRAVMVTLDLVGIDRELSLSVCEALRERYGLSRRQIALCTSHTHTGPVVGRNLAPLHYLLIDEAQRRLVDEYAQTLRRRIVSVVGEALEDLSGCRLSWGSAQATFAVNRRNNSASLVPKLRAEGKLRGPFDHDVPVLAVRGEGDRLRSVVFGYACHATVLNAYQWSGDYPGFAQIDLQKAYPGCVAMFWAGCGADQNPLPRRTVELAREYGGRLAQAVQRALAGDMKPVRGNLATSYREIDLPLDELPTSRQIAEDARSDNRFVASRAKMLLEKIRAEGSLSQTYPYPVAVWRIGDEIQFVILGGEVVVDFAVRIKSELGPGKTWVAAYANDVMAYIPSRRVLREGRYEGGGAMVYYGLPTVWAPQVEAGSSRWSKPPTSSATCSV